MAANVLMSLPMSYLKPRNGEYNLLMNVGVVNCKQKYEAFV